MIPRMHEKKGKGEKEKRKTYNDRVLGVEKNFKPQ